MLELVELNCYTTTKQTCYSCVCDVCNICGQVHGRLFHRVQGLQPQGRFKAVLQMKPKQSLKPQVVVLV